MQILTISKSFLNSTIHYIFPYLFSGDVTQRSYERMADAPSKARGPLHPALPTNERTHLLRRIRIDGAEKPQTVQASATRVRDFRLNRWQTACFIIVMHKPTKALEQ